MRDAPLLQAHLLAEPGPGMVSGPARKVGLATHRGGTLVTAEGGESK